MARTKSFDRDQVLGVVMQAFWQHGYKGLSLADIEQVTGVGKKSLYNEFGSKDELFLAALTCYLDMMVGGAMAILSQEPQGAQNVIQFFSIPENPAEGRGCLITKSINAIGGIPDSAHQAIVERLYALEEACFANFMATTKDPALSRRLAQFIMSVMQGLTTIGNMSLGGTYYHSITQTVIQTIRTECGLQASSQTTPQGEA